MSCRGAQSKAAARGVHRGIEDASALDASAPQAHGHLMCSIFSTIQPHDYAFQTRSVRLGGHATSIRLEAMYWATLDEIAKLQSVPLGRFLTKLNDEVLSFDENEPHNFASLLRCACMTYLSEVKGKPEAVAALQMSAAAEFGIPAGRSARYRAARA